MALCSLRAWSAFGFGKARLYVPPLAEVARILADKRVEATVTVTKEVPLKVS